MIDVSVKHVWVTKLPFYESWSEDMILEKHGQQMSPICGNPGPKYAAGPHRNYQNSLHRLKPQMFDNFRYVFNRWTTPVVVLRPTLTECIYPWRSWRCNFWIELSAFLVCARCKYSTSHYRLVTQIGSILIFKLAMSLKNWTRIDWICLFLDPDFSQINTFCESVNQ